MDFLHTCAAKNCPREVHKRFFMCRPHWFRIPKHLRHDLSNLWHIITDKTTPPVARAHADIEYRAAREEAVRLVALREELADA